MVLEGAVPAPAWVADQGSDSMDRSAFESLFERTHRRLFGYLCRVAGDAGLAEDALQDAYLRLLLAKQLPTEPRALESYLYRTATHRVYDRWRRTRRETAWSEQMETSAPAQPDISLRRDLEKLMAELEPRQRALLWLAHAEGWSHREIARVVGVKEASVKVLLFRLRRQLARRARKLGLSLDGERT